MSNLDQLKEVLMVTETSDRLDETVLSAIEIGKQSYKRKKRMKMSFYSMVAGFSLIFLMNVTPVLSSALGEIPVVGKFVKVLLVKNWYIHEDTMDLNLSTPKLDGLGNEALERALNQKYYEENKALHDEFVRDMDSIKEVGGHLGVSSDYFIVTDTERVFSIGRYTVNLVGSSSTTIKYDTVDPKEGIFITLKSLFKDDRYIGAITASINQQMVDQMAADPDKIYWTEDEVALKAIDPEQTFYITKDGKLVISFDKYQVAPGYMGVCEFTIPYEVLSGILVSDVYIHP